MHNSEHFHTITLGVSACLLGQAVRHDGGHTRNKFLTDILGQHFHFKAFCPEMAAGMKSPRPAIRLQSDSSGIRAVVSNQPDIDMTDRLNLVSEQTIRNMNDIAGYILKKDSPSCGMERVRIYRSDNQVPTRDGRGLFAVQLMRRFPLLPVEEEGRLQDPVLRENFIARVFAYHRWNSLCKEGLSVKSFQAFHAQHKFSLLAHDEHSYRQLGPLVARTTHATLETSSQSYIHAFMQALRKPATRKRNTNVLMHIMGYIKHELPRPHKKEMFEILENYRLGRLPLIVPITLLKHHLRNVNQPYINTQSYMQPYPEALSLRNNV